MRIPFSLKVGLTTAVLTVGVTSGGLFMFYSYAYELLLGEITGRLRDVGYLGTFQFDEEMFAIVERLQEATAEGSQLSSAEIRAIPVGEFASGLPEELAEELHQTPDYQAVVQLLRRVDYVGSQERFPPMTVFPQPNWELSTLGSYLMAPIPGIEDYAQIQFIGSSRYEAVEAEEWPGNPLGTVYAVADPTFMDVWTGVEQTTGIYTDIYGTWISTLIPILTADGRVVAVLGLDYDATNAANQLLVLRSIGVGIILVSLGLSLVGSVLLARWIGIPIQSLRQGAERVRLGDYRTQVNLKSRDEFGLLAATFNNMVDEIRNQSEVLEATVASRTVELAEANEAISVLNQQLQNENQRMEAELQVTRELQRMILPGAAELQQIPTLDIAGYMEPASEIGGDYYDVLVDHGQVKIGIGDVTGHGLQSGVLMLMVQTAVRTLLASNERDPIRFLAILNRVIYANIERMQADKNLTLSLLDYYADGSVRLSGSHEEMIVVRKNGDLEQIQTVALGLPLGLTDDIRAFVGQQVVQLQAGDVVVLYTDGVTEAANMQGDLYSLDRLCIQVQAHCHESAINIQKAIIQDLRVFIGDQEIYDDVTLLVMKQL